ncbi:hypothetical protein, partial, partial [Parasitella parasitica]
MFVIPKKNGGVRPAFNLKQLNQFLDAPHFKMETIREVSLMIQLNDYLQSLPTHLEALVLTRDPDFGILGRLLAVDRRIQTVGDGSGSTDSLPPTGPWMAHQLQEIGARSHSTVGTPRLCIEYPVYDSPTSSKQTERYSSFDQTGNKQTSSPVASGRTQFDNANTSSDICYLPSSPLHSLSAILQKSNSEIGSILGSSSISGSREPAGTAVVVRQNSQVEWPLNPTVNSQPNNICGHQQHGMGCSWSHRRAHGYWTAEEAAQSIKWRELKAAQLALKTLPLPAYSTVSIRTDNTTSHSYINKQGGARSLPLLELATE